MLAPGTAFANKSPEFALANLPWLLLAELAVVALETALLRWLLRLPAWSALRIALLANAWSFLAGLVVSGLLMIGTGLYPHQGYQMLLGLSDYYLDPLGAGAEMPRWFFIALGLHTFGNLLIETPVLYLLARQHIAPGLPRPWARILLVNLLSYPMFFTGLFLVTLVITPR
jgi:hypothetical protein